MSLMRQIPSPEFGRKINDVTLASTKCKTSITTITSTRLYRHFMNHCLSRGVRSVPILLSRFSLPRLTQEALRVLKLIVRQQSIPLVVRLESSSLNSQEDSSRNNLRDRLDFFRWDRRMFHLRKPRAAPSPCLQLACLYFVDDQRPCSRSLVRPSIVADGIRCRGNSPRSSSPRVTS